MLELIEYIRNYILIMFCMCADNICWIPDSSEWNSIKKHFNTFTIFNKVWAIPKDRDGVSYCWHKRILEVLKHPRDIVPAILTAGVLTWLV